MKELYPISRSGLIRHIFGITKKAAFVSLIHLLTLYISVVLYLSLPISKLASNIGEMRLWLDAKAQNSSYSVIYVAAGEQHKDKKTAKSKQISLAPGS